MLQKETRCIKSRGWKLLNRMKMWTFFLFCLNIIFFSFSTALQKQQKILTRFPEDKLSTIYEKQGMQKVLRRCKICILVLFGCRDSSTHKKHINSSQALENFKEKYLYTSYIFPKNSQVPWFGMYFYKCNLPSSLNSKSLHPPTLNASCFLL